MLNLAVCPAAACSPISSAKVPHAIGIRLPVLWQAMAIMRHTISPHAITKLAARPSALSAGKPRCHGNLHQAKSLEIKSRERGHARAKHQGK